MLDRLWILERRHDRLELTMVAFCIEGLGRIVWIAFGEGDDGVPLICFCHPHVLIVEAACCSFEGVGAAEGASIHRYTLFGGIWEPIWFDAVILDFGAGE